MLVLSRKETQTIVIPQVGIRITIVEIKGDSVRVGIQAPKELDVHREEVWGKIRLDEHLERLKGEG